MSGLCFGAGHLAHANKAVTSFGFYPSAGMPRCPWARAQCDTCGLSCTRSTSLQSVFWCVPTVYGVLNVIFTFWPWSPHMTHRRKLTPILDLIATCWAWAILAAKQRVCAFLGAINSGSEQRLTCISKQFAVPSPPAADKKRSRRSWPKPVAGTAP